MRCSYHVKLRLSLRASQSAKDATSCSGLLDKRKAADRRAKPLPSWHLHDLRRTCATAMAELGILPHVIETTLNHVSGHKAGVAGVYNRSKMTDAVREGLQRWADHLDQITA